MSDQMNPFPLLRVYKEDNGKIVETNCDERQLIQMKEMGWSMNMPKSGPPDIPMPKELSKSDTPKNAPK